MPEKKLTQKAKALLYDNWLKYTKSRGWSDILKKPLEIKKIIDKLKLEKKELQELNQIEHTKSFVSMAKLEKSKVDNDTLRKYNKTTTEGLQEEISKGGKLKKELDATQQLYVKHVADNIDMEAEHELFKQKLEKIKKLHKAKTNPAIMWKKLNKIFDIK